MDKDENAIHDGNKDTSVEEVRTEGTEENNESQRETFESNRTEVAIMKTSSRRTRMNKEKKQSSSVHRWRRNRT